MIDRTVRKGELYELPTGIKIPAACSGLARDGRIVTVPLMIGCLTELGYVVRERRKAKDDTAVPTGKVADNRSP